MYPLPAHPGLRPPLDVLVDAGGVEGLSGPAFEQLSGHLQVIDPFAKLVPRVSIVRPAGVAGAAVAGLFYELVQNRFRAGLFTDRAEAFRWLETGDERALAELEAVLAAVTGAPPELRSLRAYLTAHLRDPQIATAARALGNSARSLQRRLHACGTSFRQEVDRARVRAAEALLTDAEIKLEAVSSRVGCSSPSQFSRLFRRLTGETPSDFRARRL